MNIIKNVSRTLYSFLYRVVRARQSPDIGSMPPQILAWAVSSRLPNYLRGIFFFRKFVSIGRQVRIRGFQRCTFGGGLVIGDYTTLDCVPGSKFKFGSGVTIGSFCRVISGGTLMNPGSTISIGNNVGIGDFCQIGAGGGVEIGSDCIIGAYFSIHPENHIFSCNSTPIRSQGVTRVGVNIGTNCWIGAKVTILDGVNLGDNCVVAAGSVVTKSFGSNLIIAGSPAKAIGER